MLPDYISKAVPNPASNRAPWYVNTAPAYAGVFLWVVFYKDIAKGTLDQAGVGLCFALAPGRGRFLLSYALSVPRARHARRAKPGYPLYVVGSSTFGTKGGYLMPGLLMGLLQVGWISVNAFVSTSFILRGVGSTAGPGSLPFALIAIAWAYGMSYVGVKGIQYVAKFSLYLSCIPLIMIVLVFARTAGGVATYSVPSGAKPYIGFMMLIQLVVGFFATAGAAGVDFGMNSRDARDVRWGGLAGVALAILIAGGLPLMSVAGAHGLNPAMTGFGLEDVSSWRRAYSIPAAGMFILFAIASIAPACFSAFIAGNSFSTMIPGVSRMASTMVGATVAAALAVTGAAGNLVGLFTIIGASFGPICGAMMADYLLSGKKWAGPREGINWAGYGAWALGFIVGILPFLPISDE